jgi:hypothetical protein
MDRQAVVADEATLHVIGSTLGADLFTGKENHLQFSLPERRSLGKLAGRADEHGASRTVVQRAGTARGHPCTRGISEEKQRTISQRSESGPLPQSLRHPAPPRSQSESHDDHQHTKWKTCCLDGRTNDMVEEVGLGVVVRRQDDALPRRGCWKSCHNVVLHLCPDATRERQVKLHHRNRQQ